MNTITEFLSAFYPDVNEPIWLRSFPAKGVPKGSEGVARTIEVTRHRLGNDKALQYELTHLNKTQGIYFVVNAGGNKNADITRINAIFCEIDDRPIQEQHDLFDESGGYLPSIRIQTRKSVHAYWLIEEEVTCDQFLTLQKGLIQFYKSDKSIKNLSRVMRVPFFNHVSYDGGYKYQKITHQTWRPDYVYPLAGMLEQYPYAEPKHEWTTPIRSGYGFQTLDEVKAELRARIMATDSWRSHGKWGCANARCHNGEGDTGLRVDLASGAVTCWSECSLVEILHAYGLELPRPSNDKFQYIRPPEQKSDLWHWYQQRKLNEI